MSICHDTWTASQQPTHGEAHSPPERTAVIVSFVIIGSAFGFMTSFTFLVGYVFDSLGPPCLPFYLVTLFSFLP